MAIELNGLSSNQTTATRGKPAEQGGVTTEKKGNTAAPPVQADTVRLSDAVQALQQASSRQSDDTSDFNAERVTEIKAAIADGSYSVNPERIADKMLQFDKLFS